MQSIIALNYKINTAPPNIFLGMIEDKLDEVRLGESHLKSPLYLK